MRDRFEHEHEDRDALIDAMARAWWPYPEPHPHPSAVRDRMRKLYAGEIADGDLSEHDRAALALLQHVDDGEPVSDEDRVLASMRVDFEMDAIDE